MNIGLRSLFVSFLDMVKGNSTLRLEDWQFLFFLGMDPAKGKTINEPFVAQ